MGNKNQFSEDFRNAKSNKSIPKDKKKVIGHSSTEDWLNAFDDELSMMGYRDDSPYRDRSSIDIHTPTGMIDMSQTGIPLMANGQYLPPYSGMHNMGTPYVKETPIAKNGGWLDNLPKAQPGYNVTSQDNTNTNIKNKIHQIEQRDKDIRLHNNQTFVGPYNRTKELQDLINQDAKSEIYTKNIQKNILGPLDIATDIMQLGQFIPHPIAQGIGWLGNTLGAAVDADQAYYNYKDKDYNSMVGNLTGVGLGNALASQGYKRAIANVTPNTFAETLANIGSPAVSKSGFYFPLTAQRFGLSKFITNPVVKKALNANRGVLGAEIGELIYDTSNKAYGGPIDKFGPGGKTGEPDKSKKKISLKEAAEKGKQFNIDWMNSRMYKNMLSQSTGQPIYESAYAPINEEAYIKYTLDQERKNELVNSTWSLVDQEKDKNGKLVDKVAAYSNSFTPWYIGMTGIPTTIKDNSTLEDYKNYPNYTANVEFVKQVAGKKGNDLTSDATHEFSHISDKAGLLIPDKDLALMEKYASSNYLKSPLFQQDKSKWDNSSLSSNKKFIEKRQDWIKYINKPTETRANLNEFRMRAKEQKLYDPFTQPFKLDYLKNYKSLNGGWDPIENLRTSYSDDEISDMLNKISKSNSNQEQTYVKYGGWLDQYGPGGTSSGPRQPIITSDPNDPRLKAYNDSSNAFNNDKLWEKWVKNLPNNKLSLKEINDQYKKVRNKKNFGYGLAFKNKEGYNVKDLHRKVKTSDGESIEFYSNLFIKPVQPVILQKSQERQNLEQTPMLSAQITNNLPQMQVTNSHPMYMDMRGNYFPQPPTLYPYTEKQLLKMGYQKSRKDGGPIYQGGGPFIIRDQEGNASYEPQSDTIYLSKDRGDKDMIHELYHRQQALAGRLRIPEYDPYGLARKAPAITEVDADYPYYNRRRVDEDILTDEFLMDNPSFQFVNPEAVYNYQVNPNMYASFWTAEGEADAAESEEGQEYLRSEGIGPDYLPSKKKLGGWLDKYQVGNEVKKDSYWVDLPLNISVANIFDKDFWKDELYRTLHGSFFRDAMRHPWEPESTEQVVKKLKDKDYQKKNNWFSKNIVRSQKGGSTGWLDKYQIAGSVNTIPDLSKPFLDPKVVQSVLKKSDETIKDSKGNIISTPQLRATQNRQKYLAEHPDKYDVMRDYKKGIQEPGIEYVPIEAALLPATPAIRGIGTIGNLLVDAANPLGGLRNIEKGKVLSSALEKTETLPFKKLTVEQLKDMHGFLPRRQFIKNLQKEKLIGKDFQDLNYAARSTDRTNALTKLALEKEATRFRGVQGSVPIGGKGNQEYTGYNFDMSKPAWGNEISEFENMRNAGVDFNDPMSIARYQAVHIPMQQYGYRSGMPTMKNVDALYTGSYPTGYGNYMFKLNSPRDFSTGNYQDWFNKYHNLKSRDFNKLAVNNNYWNDQFMPNNSYDLPILLNRNTVVGKKGQKMFDIDESYPYTDYKNLTEDQQIEYNKYVKKLKEDWNTGWRGQYKQGGSTGWLSKYE